MEVDPTNLIFDALRISQQRTAIPTALGSAEMSELAATLRASSVWTARGTSAIYASEIKRVIDLITSDQIGPSEGIHLLRLCLKSLGYTPEGGFPDAPAGAVPPALRGTLQDLSSYRRLKLIIDVQEDMMVGAGQQFRGHTPDRLEAFPAWEIIRVEERMTSRDWPARWVICGGKPPAEEFPENAHQHLRERTGMIALKGDEIWGELGSRETFPEDGCLDVDHPPWCIGSGIGWREVPRAECVQRGIQGPNGESLEEWQQSRPAFLRGNLPLPAPTLSMKDVDQALVNSFKETTGAVDVIDQPGLVTVPRNENGSLDFSDLSAEFRAQRAAARARKEGK